MGTAVVRPRMRFDLYSHHIKVSGFDYQGKEALLEFCRSLVQYGMVRRGQVVTREMLRVFVGVTKDRRVFHFHINQKQDLIRTINSFGIDTSQIEMVEHKPYAGTPVEFKVKDTREPRDYQIPIVDYLVQPPMEGYAPSKMVELQTGRGKTFIALKAVAKLGQRTMLTIKGMYVDKWIEDVKEAFHLKPGELMVVRGSKDLRKLIELGQAGELEAKFIICTSKTMYMYFQEYEQYSGQMVSYGVAPDEFYETLGIGVRIVDEAHQEFHTVYRLDLYSHVPLTISLSATLVSDDRFMNRMYETAWPLKIRSPKVEFDKYIQILNLWYSVNNPQKIRCKNFMKQYSHVMFEQSIMKNKIMMQNYREMLSDIMRRMFVDEREPGQKALLFCATKEMCTTMCEALQQDFPELKVGRYISEDDYSVLLESDLTVTTLKSAGTAVDVPNLKRVLCSVAVSSKQANEQAIGRLRRLKDWPKETPEFVYVSAREIDKHVSYAMEKAQKLDGKVLGFREYQTDYRI